MMNQKMGQEVLDRFRDEFEQLLREKIVQELEQKYEEQLRAKDELILRLREENEEKGMSLMKMGMEMMQGMHKESGENGSVALINGKKYLEGGEELPPILQPQFQMFLPTIVSHLGLKSFLRLIESSTVFYQLAENGYLYLPMNLSCTEVQIYPPRIEFSRDMDTQFLIIHEGKPLEPQMLSYLHNSPWIRAQIENLEVTFWRDSEVKRLSKLLDFINVKSIENAHIMMRFDIEFLEKFFIKKLKTVFTTFTEFLNLPNVLKAEAAEFCFNLRDASDQPTFGDARDQKNAMDFILNSTASRIVIQRLQVAPSFVDQLAKMWLAGKKKISHSKFEVRSVAALELLNDILDNNKIVYADMNLAEVRVKDVRNIIIDPIKPMVIRGTSMSFVLIREDHSMLSVFAQQLDNRRSRPGETAYEVSMKKMADE